MKTFKEFMFENEEDDEKKQAHRDALTNLARKHVRGEIARSVASNPNVDYTELTLNPNIKDAHGNPSKEMPEWYPSVLSKSIAAGTIPHHYLKDAAVNSFSVAMQYMSHPDITAGDLDELSKKTRNPLTLMMIAKHQKTGIPTLKRLSKHHITDLVANHAQRSLKDERAKQRALKKKQAEE